MPLVGRPLAVQALLRVPKFVRGTAFSLFDSVLGTTRTTLLWCVYFWLVRGFRLSYELAAIGIRDLE